MRRFQDRRPCRPPDWAQSSLPHHRDNHQHHYNQHHYQPQPQHQPQRYRPAQPPSPQFVVTLIRPASPAPAPARLSVLSSGRVAARLVFRSLTGRAADAARELWALRLEGLHLLTPQLPEPTHASHAAPLIASLFADHASLLLDSGLVDQCAARSAELAASIQDVKKRLASRRGNRFRDFDQLHLQKETLEAEKALVDGKIAEYKASMRSIWCSMLCATEEEEEGVDVFGILKDGELDFTRVHMMMLRECRRLKEGMPIYAYRRRILDHIFSNQVMILIGETGSGKSTQLVQFLADSGLAAGGSIICTQPRKIAAISLADRVGDETKGCYRDNSVPFYSTFNYQDLGSKIVFTTDSCLLHHCMSDTSQDEVKYVVDSGLAKECRFVPSSGLNVLKVNWISQSSANQRAGRAGRTGVGKCYRLYSESDFGMMQVHQEPEIRKVHLGTAVLRILALGVRNVQNFEFVDSPDPEAINMAVNNLEQIGAIEYNCNGFELTDTGRHLVKLGIEPRLGKIMLDCFSYGLNKEGVVLAAVMANSSSIFCRVGTDEEKYKADRLKVPFCHPNGDLFTLLAVYKKWEDEHENKNVWCWQNSFNAKTLRRCQETISELENCLKHELNIIVPSYWRWNPEVPTEHDTLLKRILLSSLRGNLAMFSGHERFGYQVISGDQPVQLHPSCSLLVYDSKPEWVVFSEILSVPNQYLVCVTAVDHDALCTVHPMTFIKQLEKNKLQMKVITGIGNILLRRFCGKFDQNLQKIISLLKEGCRDDCIAIERDFKNNEVLLFAKEHDMEKVFHVVSDALELEAKMLQNECLERSVFPGRFGSSPVALFGSGAEIKHLELEKRDLTVEVMHQNACDIDDKELICLVETLVPGIAHFYKIGNETKWGKITFLKPEYTKDAVSKLNGVEFHGSLLKVVPVRSYDSRGFPFPAVRAKVCWPRKPSRGLALVTCVSGEAEFVVKDCFALGVGGRYVKCEVSKKYENCVFVTGVPLHVTEPELYDAFRGTTTRRILDTRLLRGSPTASPSTFECEEALRREISVFMPNRNFPGQNFHVEVFPPEERDSMMRAAITFDGGLHREAARALDHLQGRTLPCCLPWQIIQCQNVFTSTVSCPVRIYNVISQAVASLLESFRSQKGVSYSLEKNENGNFRVKLIANATKTIADLRRPLEVLMKGKTINHPDLTLSVIQLLVSCDGMSLMKSVEKDTGTYIWYDRQSLNVKAFGHPDQVAAAEEKLVHALLQLHEKKPLEIRLRGRNLPPSLMREAIKKFGADLEGFKKRSLL
ncbi:hypothetical protein PR202_gb21691 [Eleusine coracana subsp. coracana]|uniref:RNA helicase n=1 Tax=Eleusine coracana subsp. coracana TaxID=191504 RepID=A0AAV5FDU0_ELECO|nr:hypothetical protein PR202_gb21691 [Eleusine coracana subsp. coracana]